MRFLDQRVVSQVDESNHFTITDNDQTSLHLDFDYFGKSSGVVVQVLYTGVRENIELDGKIIDGKIYGIDKPKKTNSWVIKVLQNRSFRRWIFIGVMTLLMAMTLLQYLLLFQVISKEWFVSSPFYTDSSKLNFLPTTIAYSLLSLSYIMLYLSIFCSKLKKCPAELRKHIFLDEFLTKKKRDDAATIMDILSKIVERID